MNDLASWREAIGRSETRRQRLDEETARRYAAAVGANLDVERAFPPLGHWAFFLDVASPDVIGPDGHPLRGRGLIPNITLPRRMFAGATLSFAAPLALGEEAEQVSTIVDVRHRSGRTGDLVFVEVEKAISQAGTLRLREVQTIVYREAGAPQPPVTPSGDVEGELWSPTSVDLFRFSAATFNSHRIHYDARYATGEEGYPALVVHGPFTAAKLFALAQRENGGVASFTFQAKAPLFVDQPVRLVARGGEVSAIRCDGETAMSATYT